MEAWYKTNCPDCGPLFFSTDENPNLAARFKLYGAPCEGCRNTVPVKPCAKPTAEEWLSARVHASKQPSCTADYLAVA